MSFFDNDEGVTQDPAHVEFDWQIACQTPTLCVVEVANTTKVTPWHDLCLLSLANSEIRGLLVF